VGAGLGIRDWANRDGGIQRPVDRTGAVVKVAEATDEWKD
jgi:hypothetical protein